MITKWILISYLCYSTAAEYAQIKLSPVVWEDLPQNEDGGRILLCRNYDPETKHRYRWRLNGTSVLPQNVEVRRGKLIFHRKLHAYRNFLVGEYACCIHESLGKACYVQDLHVRDYPQQIGLDLSNSNTLHAKIGNSYDIRLATIKDYDGVDCSFTNETIPANVAYWNHKDKKGKYYQIRIRNFSEDNVGVYECVLKYRREVKLKKKFTATLDPEPAAASFSFVLSVCVFTLTYTAFVQLY